MPPSLQPTSVGLRDLQRVHQRHHVLCHQVVAIGPRVAGAAAVAAAVHQNDRVMRRHRGDLVGLAWFYKGLTPDNMAQAGEDFFDRALSIDPDNVDALIGSAAADVVAGASWSVTDPKTAFAAAEAKLTRALSSVPDHAHGHMLLGFVEMLTKRASKVSPECEHALTLDRNLATAHAFIGLGKIYVGRAEETEAHIAEALRLSPRDTMAYTWMTIVAVAKNNLGR